MPDRYRPIIPLVRGGQLRLTVGRIRSDTEAAPVAAFSATSTGQRSLRVTFAQPVERVPILALPGAWSVRRLSGEELIVVSATPQPATGAVEYVDLVTVLEQSFGADDIVELYGLEVA